MNQFENIETESLAPRPPWSALAVTSFVLALTCVLSPLGVLLGLVATVKRGGKRGLGFAIAAILVGAVLSVVAYGLGYLTFLSYRLVEKGPRIALTAGFDGDAAGFKAEFHGAGAAAPDESVESFVEQLRSRYGEFAASQQAGPPPQQPPMGQGPMEFPYRLTFDRGNADATVEVIFADPDEGFVWRIGSIEVHDADQGDVRFPPDAP